MSTDSSQVMRVLDRCLDTAGPDSSTVPGVAAAAAKAKTDPDMHEAISLLLAAEGETTSWDCARHIMAAAREAESGNCRSSLAERCDSADPGIVVLSSRAHQFISAAGEVESGNCRPSLAERCDSVGPAIVVLNSCMAASRATSEADCRTAVTLAGMLLAAIVLERSSFGTDQSRQLRNWAAHGDIATARTLWRRLPGRQPVARQQSGPDSNGTSR